MSGSRHCPDCARAALQGRRLPHYESAAGSVALVLRLVREESKRRRSLRRKAT